MSGSVAHGLSDSEPDELDEILKAVRRWTYSPGRERGAYPITEVVKAERKMFRQAKSAILAYSDKRVVEALNEVLLGVANGAITTLDTDPQGPDRVKNIPVGSFVRLKDIRETIDRLKSKHNREAK